MRGTQAQIPPLFNYYENELPSSPKGDNFLYFATMSSSSSISGLAFNYPPTNAERNPGKATVRIATSYDNERSFKKANVAIWISVNAHATIYDKIYSLPHKRLLEPISIMSEPDEEGYFASAPDIPRLYGCGDTRIEAIEMLKHEIESLYDDLKGGEEFTEDWNDIKHFLLERIVD